MPVIVMKVDSVKDHPNADALKIYEFSAPEVGSRQIIANLQNSYNIGDLAYVALEGSVLKDGTKIKPTKIRDISSYGMALGKVDDSNILLGSDVSSQFCQEEIPSDKVSFVKWPDIESFFNVRRSLEKIDFHPKIKYRGKVKADGTNASVIITRDGKFAAQNRSRIITPQDDNYGFAAWAYQYEDYFKSLDLPTADVTIFGEWAGKKIQSGVAISQLDKRVFAVFAIQYDYPSELLIEPQFISQVIESGKNRPDNIYVLPWYGDEIELDFSSITQLEDKLKIINKMVADVESCDPWVKNTFGIEGVGEGLVLYPDPDNGIVERDRFTNFIFKAKGDKHKVVNTKKSAQIDPEVANNVNEFVNLFVTENRLNQGVEVACGGEFNPKKMGDFLKWVGGDIKKESVAELDASKLEWKDVSRRVSDVARDWYLNKVKRTI